MPLPVRDGIVTALFGPTDEPLDSGGVNKGIDISVPIGTDVYATAGGTVVAAGADSSGWGTRVVIQDAQGNLHSYGHLSTVAVKVGQKINPGQVVAKSGNTGKSTGAHLSYDVLGSSGEYVAPSPWLGFEAAGDNRSFQRTSLSDMTGGALNGRAMTGDQGDGMGGVDWNTAPSGGGTGRFYEDPRLDQEYEQLRKARQDAYDAYLKAGSPADGPLFYAYADAQDALGGWMQDNETFRVPYEDPARRAQDAIDSGIRLGDFNLREADSAFNRWLQSTGEARAAATTEYDRRAAHNADNVALQEARNTSQTPGMLPRVTDAGYVEQSFDQIYNRYKQQAGVSGPFDPEAAVGTSGVTPGAVAPGATPGGSLPAGSAGSIWDRAKAASMEPAQTGAQSAALYSSANQAMRSADGTMDQGQQQGRSSNWSDQLNKFGTRMPYAGAIPMGQAANLGIMGGNLLRDYGTSAGSKLKKTGKKWWNRAFAEGGTNLPGGPALVGERPEIVEVPGFGARVVDSPTELNLPEGANVIPIDELMALQQIRQAAAAPAQNPTTTPEAQAARANDPQLQQKVMASLRKAMASGMASNPPMTPILPPGVKDYFAPYRQLTGVPATEAEMVAAQQGAKK